MPSAKPSAALITALVALGFAIVAMILAFVALVRAGDVERRQDYQDRQRQAQAWQTPESPVATPPLDAAAPPVVVTPEPPPPPTPTPLPTPSDRTRKLMRYRLLADRFGRLVATIEARYPRMPARVPTDRTIYWMWPGWCDPDCFIRELGALDGLPDSAPSLGAIDDAGRAFLAHLDAWAKRWSAQYRYLDRGEYLDDDFAAGRAADADLRSSLAEATRRAQALEQALAAPWQDELARVPPASDRAAFDRAWETCRGAAAAPAPAKTAIRACTVATDELRERRIAHIWMPNFLSTLDSLALGMRDRDTTNVPTWVMYGAQIAAQMRPELSEAQAEASP